MEELKDLLTKSTGDWTVENVINNLNAHVRALESRQQEMAEKVDTEREKSIRLGNEVWGMNGVIQRLEELEYFKEAITEERLHELYVHAATADEELKNLKTLAKCKTCGGNGSIKQPYLEACPDCQPKVKKDDCPTCGKFKRIECFQNSGPGCWTPKSENAAECYNCVVGAHCLAHKVPKVPCEVYIEDGYGKEPRQPQPGETWWLPVVKDKYGYIKYHGSNVCVEYSDEECLKNLVNPADMRKME